MDKLHRSPVSCDFLIDAGSHAYGSSNYVTYLRRNVAFFHLLLPRADVAVRNHTYIVLGFHWRYTAHTQGVCCGESEHLIGNKVYMD